MSDANFAPGELPDIAVVQDGFGENDLGPERSQYSGRMGASDVPDRRSIPHLKDSELPLLGLLGTMDEKQWEAIGVDFRLATNISGAAADMVRDMMAEVVYQLKARHNGLSAEDQGLVAAAAKKTKTVTVTELPEASKLAIMDALDSILDFPSLEALKLSAGVVFDGINEKLGAS